MYARVQRVHLVDAHAVESAVLGLERVEQRHRLPVRHRHDDVRLARDVVEDRFGSRRLHAVNLAQVAGFPQWRLRPTRTGSAG
jgi:hypothetical protein